MPKSTSSNDQPRVIIVGAGLAGIIASIALKKQLGFDNFTMYEKAESVGGVWRDNSYPGCGSDVPAHWYSFSSELNPNWSSYYGSQPEIETYWQDVWARYNLSAQTVFHTEVILAEWDEAAQVYHVTLEDVRTKAQRVEDANILWWAVGGFQAPFYPEDVPGVKEFRGDVWHSACWRHDVDLKGKRVAVIGNGCSGAQFVPKISEDPSVQVTNFVRSAQWYVPRQQYTYSSTAKWIFRHVPFVMRAYRTMIYALAEFNYFLVFNGVDTAAQKRAIKQLTEYIKSKAPKEYLDFLIPKFPPGCKRVIIDPDYLDTLNRPNVHLDWTPIEGIVEDGLKLTSGEIVPFDVIIFATGFSLEPPRMKIVGRNNLSMSSYFDSIGGPSAYVGTSIPNFPNLYMLLGPNTAGGHASVIFNEEVQVDHALQLIRPVVEHKVRSFEVRKDVFERYNVWIQNRLARSVWSLCTSYYRRRADGGRNVAIFPGTVTLFWWIARKANRADYVAVGADEDSRKHRARRIVRAVVCVLLAFAFAGFGANRAGWTLPPLVAQFGLKSA